ncbi:predicted oxidoreductase [Microbacterium testaceum StLB037]|uniref:Predicted oxidoreductase n=1 Tax=Microbacterium testaceum (strain StLB037) TaxID=979556 RepID=E8NGR6_MICTS|nr:aldo/keto reductase [Microbacterium testaceum]BAJ75365.1 predicted oxidoreductase [Microbacterium testaceum StLB037]
MHEAPLATARIGLGLAAVGRPAYITTDRDHDLGDGGTRSIETMCARTHALLDEAWALGIRYVDAARSYGYAERFLGSWLTAHPERRAALTIGSKWGYEYVGGWRMDATVHERKEHSAAMLEKQWLETLAALGSAPDLYLIHSVTPDSPALGDSAVLGRLREIAADGVRVGISTSGPRQGDVIDEARQLADSPFSVVQATWNLREQAAAPALARAHAAGWTVVVKEALAGGELARPEPDSHLADFAAGRDGASLALGVARAQPWADIVLSGAATIPQLRRGAAATAREIDAETLGRWASDPEEYWRRRAARPWR